MATAVYDTSRPTILRVKRKLNDVVPEFFVVNTQAPPSVDLTTRLENLSVNHAGTSEDTVQPTPKRSRRFIKICSLPVASAHQLTAEGVMALLESSACSGGAGKSQLQHWPRVSKENRPIGAVRSEVHTSGSGQSYEGGQSRNGPLQGSSDGLPVANITRDSKTTVDPLPHPFKKPGVYLKRKLAAEGSPSLAHGHQQVPPAEHLHCPHYQQVRSVRDDGGVSGVGQDPFLEVCQVYDVVPVVEGAAAQLLSTSHAAQPGASSTGEQDLVSKMMPLLQEYLEREAREKLAAFSLPPYHGADLSHQHDGGDCLMYDVYVPEAEAMEEGPVGASGSSVLYPSVDVCDADCDLYWEGGEVDEGSHDSEDSNAESYYANSYPDEEEDREDTSSFESHEEGHSRSSSTDDDYGGHYHGHGFRHWRKGAYPGPPPLGDDGISDDWEGSREGEGLAGESW